MKKLIATPLFFFVLTSLFAQNLVPNYSFETYAGCPSNLGLVGLATPWFLPGTSTPDYFNACDNPPPSFLGVPSNAFGYQAASTGNAYCGFYATVGSFDEHLTAPLTSPLVAGTCYYGEMYFSLAESFSTIGMDKLGMYLTNGAPTETPLGEIIATPAPQIYGNQIIVDTAEWVQVSGVFVADGGETHITLGQFFPDNEINYQAVVTPPPPINTSYYYVDDVSLFEIDENTVLDYTICEGDCITIASNQYCDEGAYVITIPECTNGVNSFTINIMMQGSEDIVLAPVSMLDCNSFSTTLDASGSSGLSSAESYGWTGPNFSSTEAIADVGNPGWYTFSITSESGCQIKDSIEVLDDYELPNLSIAPLESWDCISSNITITGNSSTPAVTYAWAGPGTNASTSSVSINQSGTYQLLITAANGCTSQGQITVPPDYFVTVEADGISSGILDCNNTNVSLIGSTNISQASFLWSGPGLNETTQNATTNQSGIYNFTVTSSVGCTATAQVEIFENTTPPDVYASILSTVDCVTGSIQLGGFSTIDNPYYTWSGPGTFEELDVIDATIPGIYTFSVLDLDNGCSSSTDVTLTADDLIIPTIVSISEPDEISCTSALAILSGVSDAIDPTYLWIGPPGFVSDPAQNSSTNIPGSYTFIVTASNGCSISATTQVIENINPPDLIINAPEELDCDNPEIVLVGSSSISNPIYEWQAPSGNIFNDSLFVNSPGVYTLEVTNPDNNCSTIEEIEVIADLAVPTSDAGANGILDCTNSSFNLDAGNSTGDNLTYSWVNS
ncbi:MAG: hypothetical protein ACI9VN_000955, partial [Patescibacteria group bacterium]